MEDKNTNMYYCYDNFSSYSSVLDMELIKYRDKPDTAIIKLTNLSGMLSYRLFDDSVNGRMEWRYRNTVDAPVSTDGTPLIKPDGLNVGIRASRGTNQNYELSGRNYQDGRGNLTDPQQDFKNNQARVPLKYYPLQTGSTPIKLSSLLKLK